VPSGFPLESQMGRSVEHRKLMQKRRTMRREMAVVVQNAFQDNHTGYGNGPQRVNLLFKRRAYLTATINF
jgi:hypothetical protein